MNRVCIYRSSSKRWFSVLYLVFCVCVCPLAERGGKWFGVFDGWLPVLLLLQFFSARVFFSFFFFFCGWGVWSIVLIFGTALGFSRSVFRVMYQVHDCFLLFTKCILSLVARSFFFRPRVWLFIFPSGFCCFLLFYILSCRRRTRSQSLFARSFGPSLDRSDERKKRRGFWKDGETL